MDGAGIVSGPLPMEDGKISASKEVAAFADAVTTHQSLVFSIAFHMLRDKLNAEEVAQDVFLRLYQDFDRIQSASHLVHWLRRTTIHRCLDILRRLKKHPQVPLDEIDIASSSPATEQDLILSETLRRLVSELPANARAVVVLRYQEDLEPREIAHLLDLPVNTVKSRLQRAMNALRNQFAAFEESHYETNRE